jgi:hypothetical protein
MGNDMSQEAISDLTPNSALVGLLANQIGVSAQRLAEHLMSLRNSDDANDRSIQIQGDPRLAQPIEPGALYPNKLVQKIFGVTSGTLRRWRAETGVEPYRLSGRMLVWDGAQIIELLEKISS